MKQQKIPGQSAILPPAAERWRITAVLAGSAGNLVEWYDWYVYAAFSLYFAKYFFPGSNSTAQLINTAGIFAVGFLMRPLGGYLFGRLADRNGRKTAMAISVLLMALGSLLIGLLPGYHQIGIAAPLLLLVARMLQGLSTGGEYGASATYLSETATSGRRGFYSSFQYVTLIGGQLLAIAVQLILQVFVLSESQLQEWGWRIPFLLGALLSLAAYRLRNRMPESDAFENETMQLNKRGSLRALARHPKAVSCAPTSLR